MLSLQVGEILIVITECTLTLMICRAARYCDTDCQRADFRAGHKDECKGFARLPNTMVFQYEPNPEERFPHHPIFAHAHADDVGCWVTVDGRVDGE